MPSARSRPLEPRGFTTYASGAYAAGGSGRIEQIAAAMKDGLSRESAEAKAQMSGLGEAAATAAQALEKAKVASDIKFGNNTALLS